MQLQAHWWHKLEQRCGGKSAEVCTWMAEVLDIEIYLIAGAESTVAYKKKLSSQFTCPQ